MIHIVLRISQPRNVVPGMLCTGRGYFPRGSNLSNVHFPRGSFVLYGAKYTLSFLDSTFAQAESSFSKSSRPVCSLTLRYRICRSKQLATGEGAISSPRLSRQGSSCSRLKRKEIRVTTPASERTDRRTDELMRCPHGLFTGKWERILGSYY